MSTIAEAELRINPKLDIQEFNKLLKLVKGSLGELGGDIQLIDPDALEKDIKETAEAFDKLNQAAKDAFDGQELTGYRKNLGNVKDGLLEISGLKSGDGAAGLFNLEAAERFSGFLEGAAGKAQESNEAMRLLGAQTGATGDELARLETIAANVFQSGGFESFSDAISAIGTAKKAFGDALDDAGIQAFTSGAAGIAKVLDVDVNEVLQKSGTFVQQFGLDGQRAYELVALGAQKAGTSQDDFLDSLSEYSGLAKEAGLSAEEFVGILVAGGEAAAFNTDKIADSLKETQIRLNAGDIKFDDVAGLGPELKSVLETGLKQATAGDISIADFMSQSVKSINEAGLTDAMEAKLFAAISGTPAEDLGNELYGDIFGADIDTASIQAQAAAAGAQIGEAIAPQSVFEQLTLYFESSFGALAGYLGPALGPASQFLQITTALGPAAQALKLGALAKDAAQFGLSILSKVIPGLVTQTAVTTAQAGATAAATTTQYALNTAMLANPAFLLVAGVGALIGAFVLFSDSGESVEEAMEGVNSAMAETNKVMADTAASDKTAEGLRNLAGEYDKFKDSGVAEEQKKAAAASKELADAVPEARDNMEALNDEVERGNGVLSINTEAVLAHADSMTEMNKVAREGALAKLRREVGELIESTGEAQKEVAGLTEDQQEFLELAANYDDAGLSKRADAFREKAAKISEEAGELATQYNAGNTDLQKGVKLLVDQGVSVKDLAKEYNKTEDEIKQIVKREEEAEKAALDAADATGKIGDAAAQSAGEVASLGSQFDAMLKNAQDGVRSTTSDLAGLLNASRNQNVQALGKIGGFLTGGKNALDAIKTGLIAQGKEQDKLARQGQADLDLSRNLITGEQRRSTAKRGTAKAQKSAFEKAQEEYGVVQKTLELQERQVEIARESERIAEGRESGVLDSLASEQTKLDVLKSQEASLRTLLQVADGADFTLENIGINLKESEQFDASQLIGELQADIQEQANAVQAVKLSAGIEVDEDAIQSLQEQQLQLQISLGLKEESTFTDFLIADVERIEGELSAFTDSEKARYDTLYENKVLSESEYATLVEQLETGTHQRQLEFQNVILQRKQQLRDRALELELNRLDRQFAAETKMLDDIAEETVRVRESIAEAVESIEDGRITRDQDEELAKLEDRYEKELITTERFEEEKTALEEKAERKRAGLAARLRGEALEADRLANLDALELQRAQLEEKRDALLAAGNLSEAAKITEQVEDIGLQIADKAGFLSSTFGEIQGELGDAVVTLFDFDEERAKEPWRNMFGIIGGGLERLAKAKATEFVLGLISGVGGFPGLLLSFAAKPIVEGLIGRLISPVLGSILSFASGGEVNEPTLAVLGDAANLGEANTEWVLNNQNMQDLIGLVVDRMQESMVGELRLLRHEVADLQFRLHVSGSDLTTATDRYRAKQSRRVINRTALAA